MSWLFVTATEWLSHRLMREQWVETQIATARRRDAVLMEPLPKIDRCICGDPACELPWSDGGESL